MAQQLFEPKNLAKHLSIPMSNFKTEEKKLLKNSMVKTVIKQGNTINIITQPLIYPKEIAKENGDDGDAGFNLGSYIIQIKHINKQYNCRNLHEKLNIQRLEGKKNFYVDCDYQDSLHPHISKHGELCTGTAEWPIKSALQFNQFNMAFEYILLVLEDLCNDGHYLEMYELIDGIKEQRRMNEK